MTRMSSMISGAEQTIAQINTVVKEARSIRDVCVYVPAWVDHYTQHLDVLGWSVKWGYVIKDAGFPNTRRNMGPNADGKPAQVHIVDVCLLANGKEIYLPLSAFTPRQIADVRAEIVAEVEST